jgi:S1-C subfamily serine protease
VAYGRNPIVAGVVAQSVSLREMSGAVLGVNAAGIDVPNHIGFAISSSTVADIFQELIEAGVIRRVRNL